MRNPNAVVFAGLMPHAPVLVPSVGADRLGRVHATVEAMRVLSRRVLAAGPDLLVVLSPHSPRSNEAFGLWQTDPLAGSFAAFGAAADHLRLPLDRGAAERLEHEASARLLRTWRITRGALDHGALVPLHYLAAAGWRGPTLVVGLDEVSPMQLALLGEAIAETAAALDRRAAVIASGDMSHRLAVDAPCGYHPAGSRFDERFIGLLQAGDNAALLQLDGGLCDLAAEDVVTPVRVAVAAAGYRTDGRAVLSYEGPFGVGYGVAVLFASSASDEQAASGREAEQPGTVRDPSELPAVARRSVTAALEGRPEERAPRALGPALASRGGVFVTLYTDTGALRGCRGSPQPQDRDLAEATWYHARQAAFADPRFPAVEWEELPRLRFTVSVLGALEPVARPEELDPAHFGVLVSSLDHDRQGLLLPGVPTIDSIAEQIHVAKVKGGLGPAEPVTLQRFTTRVFAEPVPHPTGGHAHAH